MGGFKKIYDGKELCITCGQSPQKIKSMCQKCYNRQRPIKVGTCELCKKESNIYSKNYCKFCYDRQRYLQKNPKLLNVLKNEWENDSNVFYSKRTATNCIDCNVLFNDKNRSAKNRCGKCYTRWSKTRKSNICLVCNIELDREYIRPICDGCKISDENPHKKKKDQPTDWEKTQMKILMVKAKWGLLNHIDMFRIIHVYLLVVNQDELINSYSHNGMMQYCLKKFHEWVT